MMVQFDLELDVLPLYYRIIWDWQKLEMQYRILDWFLDENEQLSIHFIYKVN